MDIVESSLSGKQEQNRFLLRRDLKGTACTKWLLASGGKPWGGSPAGDIGGSGGTQGLFVCPLKPLQPT